MTVCCNEHERIKGLRYPSNFWNRDYIRKLIAWAPRWQAHSAACWKRSQDSFFPYKRLFEIVWLHGKRKSSQQDKYYLTHYLSLAWGRQGHLRILFHCSSLDGWHCFLSHVVCTSGCLRMLFGLLPHFLNFVCILKKLSWERWTDEVRLEIRSGSGKWDEAGANQRDVWLLKYISWIILMQKYKTPNASKFKTFWTLKWCPTFKILHLTSWGAWTSKWKRTKNTV